MEHLRISRADWQAMAAFLIKETALSKTMEARTTTRQILSRSEGAAAEAANMHHHRHLLIRQGDGRYLYMRAISNEEVKEALAESPAITTATFDWNELREEMDVLVTAEIVEEGYLHYLKPNEDFRSMDFEDKVCFVSSLGDSQGLFVATVFDVARRVLTQA